MITLRTTEEIENCSVDLYSSTNDFIGTLTSGIQLTDICVQIKEQELEGYFIVFEEKIIPITKEGILYSNSRPFLALGKLLRILI